MEEIKGSQNKCTELTKNITLPTYGYTSQRTSIETNLVNEIPDHFGLISEMSIGRINVQETHYYLSL